MAMTKAEAAKLTQDLLLRGVIETVVKESQLLQWLPFLDVTGTAVTRTSTTSCRRRTPTRTTSRRR